MVSPALALSFIAATLYGAACHWLAGGDARRLALLLLAGWLGFALGQMAGDVLAWSWLRVGVVNFFSASLGAWVALLGVWWWTRRAPDDDAPPIL
jgi:hypothetical protein